MESDSVVNMTLAIPDELHKVMKKHHYIKWSEVAREGIMQKAKELEFFEKALSKSKLTEKDIEELDKKIKAEVGKKFR